MSKGNIIFLVALACSMSFGWWIGGHIILGWK